MDIEQLQQEIERLQARVDSKPALHLALSAIPHTYGEAIGVYPWLKCEPHEWDNRTSAENAIYLIGEMQDMLADAERRGLLDGLRDWSRSICTDCVRQQPELDEHGDYVHWDTNMAGTVPGPVWKCEADFVHARIAELEAKSRPPTDEEMARDNADYRKAMEEDS